MQFPRNWGLPDEIQRRFGVKGAGHQRAMLADGHLLLVLHEVPLEKREHHQPRSHQLGHRKPILFWRSPDGSWQCDRNASGLRSLQQHLKSFGLASDSLSERLVAAQWADDYFQLLQDITPVELAAKNLHTALQSAREGIPDDRDLIDLRDWAKEIERSLSLLYLSTKNALDFYMARQAEEQARLGAQSIKIATRLNVLAALFFPLTAIASLFGMNLVSGFESAPGFFWLVLLAGIGAGIVMQRWVLDSKQDWVAKLGQSLLERSRQSRE